MYYPKISDIEKAHKIIKKIMPPTLLEHNIDLSSTYYNNINNKNLF